MTRFGASTNASTGTTSCRWMLDWLAASARSSSARVSASVNQADRFLSLGEWWDRQVRLLLTTVFSVGHMVSPVRIALGDREVSHEVVRGSTVPVLLTIRG